MRNDEKIGPKLANSLFLFFSFFFEYFLLMPNAITMIAKQKRLVV